MHGQKLLEFGALFGLSQSKIAEHFGINRSQVHRWAQGERPVPTERLQPLLQLVCDVVQRYLDSGQANLWHVEPAEPPQRGLTAGQVEPPLRPQIEQLLHDLIIENLEVRGVGPSASVQALGVALEPYFTMPQEALLKPANAREFLRLSTQLSVHAEMLMRLGPLAELVMPYAPSLKAKEETAHADPDR